MLHLHQRCVSMLGNLWHVQKGESAMGTATTGSSEAILLGGLAMKRRWIERQQAKGSFPPIPSHILIPQAAIFPNRTS